MNLKLQKEGIPDLSMRDQLAKFGWNPITPLEKKLEWDAVDFGDVQPPEKTSTFAALPVPYNRLHGTDDYFIDDQRGFVHVVECMAADFLPYGSPRLHLNTSMQGCNRLLIWHQGLLRRCIKRHPAVPIGRLYILQCRGNVPELF